MQPIKATNQSSNINTVIFDVGGVLHESNNATKEAMIVQLGLDQATIDSIWSTQIPLLVCGAINEAEFWQQLTKQYDVRQVDVVENLLGGAFSEHLKVHIPIINLTRQLKDKGIKIGILSNTIEPHARALKKAGVYDGFDHVILSHEVGMQKPELDIYRYTLYTIGSKPSETIFVDDIAINIAAAEAVGIRGVVFTNIDDVVAELRLLVE